MSDRERFWFGLAVIAVLALSYFVARAQQSCMNDCSQLICRDDVRCMGAARR